jgi:hypothetical protein
MRSSPRFAAVTALAALAAAIVLASPATAAAPSSARTDFKVLWVVTTGTTLYLSQDHVGATLYTLDLHNVGDYPARFTISAPGSKLVDITVKPQGWKFPRVRFKPATTYAVKVTTAPGPLVLVASLPVQ